MRREPLAEPTDPGAEAFALNRIAAAAAAEQAAKRNALAAELEASRSDVQEAVDAARLIGIGWTKIGDTLGIRSGNAYQRYRRSSNSRQTPGGEATAPNDSQIRVVPLK